MFKIGFLLEIKRCSCEQYFFCSILMNFFSSLFQQSLYNILQYLEYH